MGVTRRSCLEAQTANRRELAVERAAKKDAVEALNGLFKTTSVAVVAHYSGLTVAQMQKLRMQMKQAGASVKVSKNRLAKIALEGTDVVAIGSLLKGPTVIAIQTIRWRRRRSPSSSPRPTKSSSFWADRWVRPSWISTASRRLPRLPSLDELRGKDRRPDPGAGDQDRSARRPRPRPSSRASFRPMPQRAKRPDAFANQTWFEPIA